MSNPHADRLIAFLISSGIKDQRVLDAIQRLPRESFVSQACIPPPAPASETCGFPSGTGSGPLRAKGREDWRSCS